jgi:zinc finger FYVE domain-containing protein 1
MSRRQVQSLPFDLPDLNEEPERVIKEKFAELSLSIEAFNSLHYVGIKTNHPPTDYTPLKSILRKKIETIDEAKLRPLRTFRSIYEALSMLNEKFSGDIKRTDYTFHELHFTCDMVCEACNLRCENTKDHKKDGIEHKNDSACIYQQQLNNKLYLCKKCYSERNVRNIVRINDCNGDSTWVGLAKYAWSLGGTQIQKLDCQQCGEIFRAKWYGNKSPEEECVLAEAVHMWRDGSSRNQGENHSAQAILDGFSYISDTISSVGAQPTKNLSSWVADNWVNPAYWRKNSEIVICHLCKRNFQRLGLKIHHCECGKLVILDDN